MHSCQDLPARADNMAALPALPPGFTVETIFSSVNALLGTKYLAGKADFTPQLSSLELMTC